jgi:ketosteroid isomerase-like protein
MPTPRQIAEAFSGHRFEETLEHLADDVRWVAVGQGVLHGREAVARACRETASQLEGTTTEFLRFVTVDGIATDAGTDAGAVAVDAVARYTDADGAPSLVSSCDVYEFDAGRVAAITSYAVELDAGSPPDEQWYTRPGR